MKIIVYLVIVKETDERKAWNSNGLVLDLKVHDTVLLAGQANIPDYTVVVKVLLTLSDRNIIAIQVTQQILIIELIRNMIYV